MERTDRALELNELEELLTCVPTGETLQKLHRASKSSKPLENDFADQMANFFEENRLRSVGAALPISWERLERATPFHLVHPLQTVLEVARKASKTIENAAKAEAPQTPETRTPSESADKPRSPPRDGVNTAAVKLPREALVKAILDSSKILIIRSPPATGKTSLVDLTEAALKRRGTGVTVARLNCVEETDKATTGGLLAALARKLGVTNDFPDCFGEIPEGQDTWILIDDAQLAFGAVGFWQVVIKHLGNFNKAPIHVVIAATYDLKSESTPVTFLDYPHSLELKLSSEEAETLYNGYIKQMTFAMEWETFKDKLLKLSDGHVGVLTAGIGLLHQEFLNFQRRFTMEQALASLHGEAFNSRMHRCFPHKDAMTSKQRECVADTICQGGLSSAELIDTSKNEDPRAKLVRAGILTTAGTFSCLSAQKLYFNCFYKRPDASPNTLADLIRQSVKSMSALRLRQSCLFREFPKEAAFQQLFNQAMTLQLPPEVAVCPELNTFTTGSGKVSGELDFFITGGEIKWAVELLVDGCKINDHVARFDPCNGKYRKVGHTEYIVIDCRPPRINGVTRMENRCTLYFAHDFKSVECEMGFAHSESFSLQD